MLVILSGVSGAGKDTIKKELLKREENIVTIPSFTSREKREDEIDGQAYHFISREEFEEMIKNDELYEYDIIHNNYYGTSKKIFNDKIKEGKIIVKDIDVNGTENLINILRKDMKVVTIFLRVPKEELERRLMTRTENPSLIDIKLRLNRFDYEESKMDLYDYVLKNDDLEKTIQIIITIIKNEYNLNKNDKNCI